MNLSFGWTWPAFCAGRKTVTRRDWKPGTAQKYKVGKIHTAVSQGLWVKGAKRIGEFEVTRVPIVESTSLMADSEFQAEGMDYLDEIGYFPPAAAKACRGGKNWREFFDWWRDQKLSLTTVRWNWSRVNHEGDVMLANLLHPILTECPTQEGWYEVKHQRDCLWREIWVYHGGKFWAHRPDEPAAATLDFEFSFIDGGEWQIRTCEPPT